MPYKRKYLNLFNGKPYTFLPSCVKILLISVKDSSKTKMTLIACGVNHKTAPIHIREQLAVTPDQHSTLLQALTSDAAVNEAAILSTCNRTEVYCETPQSDHELIPWLAEQSGVDANELHEHLYLHTDAAATQHAMRVACGLDSMMLGEPQILGQMKQAYHHACNAGTMGPQLRNLFRHVFTASKRIRTDTGIGVNPVSIAFAAVDMIEQALPQLAEQRVMLIGAGETTKLVGKYLTDAGVSEFLVANRSGANAERLAMELHGQALGIGDIPEYLAQADVVISATACPLPFITKSMVARALEHREGKPIFFVDLAVPRDIEAEIVELEGVQLINIDDLEAVVAKGLSARQDAAKHAEQIIEYETQHYIRWQRSLRANQTIRVYRERMQALGQQEADRALALINKGADIDAVVEELTYRLVNKIIHQPSIRLREAAYQDHDDLLQLINQLYSDK